MRLRVTRRKLPQLAANEKVHHVHILGPEKVHHVPQKVHPVQKKCTTCIVKWPPAQSRRGIVGSELPNNSPKNSPQGILTPQDATRFSPLPPNGKEEQNAARDVSA